MISREFKDRLQDVYRGEQFGEAVFEILVDKAENEEQRYILGSLLQLETEGKALMRPVLARLGRSISLIPDSRAEGHAAVGVIAKMPWQEKFALMAESIRTRGLPKYTELATLVSADDDIEAYKLAEFMGQHERAILAVAENIAAGKENPIAPVVDLLHFPLAGAGGR